MECVRREPNVCNGCGQMKKAKKNINFSLRENLLRFSSLLITVLFFLTLPVQISCRCRFRNPEKGFSLIETVSFPERESEASHEDELVLNIGSKVEKILLSGDRKRMLVETNCGNVFPNESLLPYDPELLRTELWNIEFSDARQEAFSEAKTDLLSEVSSTSAFDEKGKNLFWIERENNKKVVGISALENDYIERGACPQTSVVVAKTTTFPFDSIELSAPPVYVPWGNSIPIHSTTTSQEEARALSLAESEFPSRENSLNLDKTEQVSQHPLERDQDEIISKDPSETEASRIDEQPPMRENLTIVQSLKSNDDMGDQLGTAFDSKERKGVDDSDSAADGGEFSKSNLQEKPVINVVMARQLDSDSFLVTSPKATNLKAKRVKTSLEMKNADLVWMSQSAKWLICRRFQEQDRSPDVVFTDASVETNKETDKVENEKTSDEDLENETDLCSMDWAIIPTKDRRRIIRFPKIVKMTSLLSGTNDYYPGRVVETLAVSDSEDLVATLVEEQVNDKKNSPRFKIVIWDLNVAATIDLSKATLPLLAVEVTQIAIPRRISKKDCKFSPSGIMFAARIDPRYLSVWQSTNGRSIAELGEHSGIVEAFDFSPSETRIVVGLSGRDAKIVVWDIRKGIACRVNDTFPSDVNSISAVVFSNDERFVYFANNIGEIRRWKARPNVKSSD